MPSKTQADVLVTIVCVIITQEGAQRIFFMTLLWNASKTDIQKQVSMYLPTCDCLNTAGTPFCLRNMLYCKPVPQTLQVK